MNFIEVKQWLELLSYAAAVLGIPGAIWIYYKDKVRDRKIKEKEVLFTSHSLYVDYLKICLDNPELDTYIFPLGKDGMDIKHKKELIVFEILFTYLESAYLYYKDQSPQIRKQRWDGWNKYIEDFASQENFKKAWDMTSGQLDEDFMRYMNSVMKKRKSSD